MDIHNLNNIYQSIFPINELFIIHPGEIFDEDLNLIRTYPNKEYTVGATPPIIDSRLRPQNNVLILGYNTFESSSKYLFFIYKSAYSLKSFISINLSFK